MAAEVRAARDSDDVGAVIKAAFGGDHGDSVAVLWREIEDSGRVLGSLVAVDAARVVGHVGLSPAWVDARRTLVDVWVLSPLSVDPDAQGAGIGTALVAAAVEAARVGGASLLFLEGSPTYYGARGFRRASELGFEPASRRTPDVAFQVVRFDPAEEWMAGRLIYPDVWWRHDLAGLRDPDLAAIEEQLQ